MIDYSSVCHKIAYLEQSRDGTSNGSRPIHLQSQLLSPFVQHFRGLEQLHLIEIGSGIGNSISALVKLGINPTEITAVEANPFCAKRMMTLHLDIDVPFHLKNLQADPSWLLTYLDSEVHNVLILFMHDVLMCWDVRSVYNLFSALSTKVQIGHTFVIADQVMIESMHTVPHYMSRNVVCVEDDFQEQFDITIVNDATFTERYTLRGSDGSIKHRHSGVFNFHSLEAMTKQINGMTILANYSYMSTFSFLESTVRRNMSLVEFQ